MKSPSSGPVTVSVVVVSYGGEGLRDCLISALAQPQVVDVILVNNRDGAPWPKELGPKELGSLPRTDPRLSLIHGQGNVGFGAGCNLGAAQARGQLLLLLNPDCRLEPDTLDRATALVTDQPDDAWMLGPHLLNPDGTEQAGGRRNAGTPGQWLAEAFPPARVFWPRVNRHATPLPTAPLTEIPAISGAFMLLPRAFFIRLGGFDDGYFLHFEDLALCRAVWRAGGRVLFAAGLPVTHLKSRSPVSGLFVTRHKIRSFRRYLWTEFAPPTGTTAPWRLAMVWTVLSVGLLAKTMMGMARARIRRQTS